MTVEGYDSGLSWSAEPWSYCPGSWLWGKSPPCPPPSLLITKRAPNRSTPAIFSDFDYLLLIFFTGLRKEKKICFQHFSLISLLISFQCIFFRAIAGISVHSSYMKTVLGHGGFGSWLLATIQETSDNILIGIFFFRETGNFVHSAVALLDPRWHRGQYLSAQEWLSTMTGWDLSDWLKQHFSHLSTCGLQPLCGSHIRYPAFQIFTLQFITVVKLQLWSSNEIIFWLKVTRTWRTVLKGPSIRKVGNHWSKTIHLQVDMCFLSPSLPEGPLLNIRHSKQRVRASCFKGKCPLLFPPLTEIM